MKTKIVLGISFLIGTLFASSQNNIHSTFEYSGPYKVFVNGNSLLQSKKKKDNNDRAIKNEDVLLYQVDADKNKNTFSSSAVTVNIPSNATIEKALLVWACNYNFCFVNDKKGEKPVKISSAKPNDGTVKFRAPFHDEYITLRPKVLINNTIYDNLENRYDPSVFSLDITNILKGKNNINGQYWFADYYTLQGQTSAGISSGWSIVIVYKSDNLENNFISGLIGYTKINSGGNSSITFPNIKNNFDGLDNIPYSLTMFFLGGDPGDGDETLNWSKNTVKRVPVNFNNRGSFGLLNGSIDNFDQRFPNNNNNFGVDIFNVKNEIPSIFFKTNNITEMTLDISSKNNNEDIQLIYSILEMPVVERLKTLKEKTPVNAVKQPNTTFDSAEKPLDNSTKAKINSNTSYLDDIVIKSYKILNVKPGYYIINGVFSKTNNRINWVKKLKSISNYKVDYFNNPLNGFDYIFCHYSQNLSEVKELVYNMKKNKNFEESWVLEVQN